MKTDRELLELAAKAAGYSVIRVSDDGEALLLDGRQQPWNPLADDAQALRLAVKLQLTICNEHLQAGQAYCIRGDEDFPNEYSQGDGSAGVTPDDYAATRRAIVRAAAAIGGQA